MIHHYTSVDTFQNIMKGYRSSEDKEHFVLWASSILSMNDPTEMQTGFDVILKRLPQIEDEMNVEEEKRISRIVTNYHVLGWTEQEKEQFFREKSFNPNLAPFVISFSKDKESIPMWYMYGKGGHGINLHLDENELNSTQGLLIVDVNYHEDIVNSPYKKTFANVIKSQYDDYLRGINGKESDLGFFSEKLETLRIICLMLSPFFKNRLYEYENESRAIFYFPSQIIKYRYSSNGFLIPYIEIPIPLKAFKAVGLGPCSDHTLLEQRIRLELDASIPNNNIEIYHSDVPLRDM